jgi:hypothetical protein
VQVLVCAFNENAAVLVPPFIQQWRPNFPTGWASREMVYSYLALPAPKNVYVPITAFIDRRFRIRSLYLGDNEFYRNEAANIQKEIEALINDSAAKPATRKK